MEKVWTTSVSKEWRCESLPFQIIGEYISYVQHYINRKWFTPLVFASDSHLWSFKSHYCIFINIEKQMAYFVKVIPIEINDFLGNWNITKPISICTHKFVKWWIWPIVELFDQVFCFQWILMNVVKANWWIFYVANSVVKSLGCCIVCKKWSCAILLLINSFCIRAQCIFQGFTESCHFQLPDHNFLNWYTIRSYHKMKMIRHEAVGKQVAIRDNMLPHFI